MGRPYSQPYLETEPPGVNIYRLREARGWKQHHLARACQPPMSPSAISRLEHNDGYTQDSLQRVARALGVPVQALFCPLESALPVSVDRNDSPQRRGETTMTSNTYAGLKDRVVIITGAGQGIGRAYAHHFAAQGAIPVIAEFNAEAGQRVEAEVKAAGARALFVQTDVADEASTLAMAEAALGAFGRIDCLINNAAVFSRITMAPFWELPVEEWRRAMDVNITGSFLCARAVVPAMQARRFGRIINVSSATMIMGRENYLHYITSKSAMVGMTRSMARELGSWDITVNTFWPGVTKTEIERPSVPNEVFERMTQMQSIKRLTHTDDLAHGVMFLCSDDAGFITGQSLQVDGGLTFI